MNKRITSLVLVLILVLSVAATAVPALAEGASTCTYTVEADKTTLKPGDTVRFTVCMQQTGTQNTLEGTLSIPEGLTYVAGSGKTADGVSAALNWTGAMEGVSWTEPSMFFNGFGSVSYTGTDKLVLMTFECTVDDDAALTDYKVDIIDPVADDEEYETKNPAVVPAAVTVRCAHTNTTPYSAEASTCKVQGHAAYTRCNDCGKIIDGSDAKLPLADHSCGSFIAEAAATHASDGVMGHYTCSVCGKNFDASGNELSSLVIAKDPNHGTPDTAWKSDALNHWHECSVAGCGVIIDDTEAAHTFVWKTDREATEDETGLKHEECSVCGFRRNENTVTEKLGHTHNLTHTAAAAATCKDPGSIEYWKCTKCGKFYSDASAANEITEAQTVTAVDSANHVGGTEIRGAKEAACCEAGYTGDTYCKSCGAKISDGTGIAAKGHTFTDGKCTACGAADPDGKSEPPQTGDNLKIFVWLLLPGSGIALAGSVAYGRKRKRFE